MGYQLLISKNSTYYKHAITLFKHYKIKYRLNWKTSSCFAYPEEEFVHIGCRYLTVQHFLSAVYHEIQHVLNYRNKKYLLYHTMNSIQTYEDIETVMRTAVKAEKYTDKYAKKLMKKDYPNIPYVGYDKDNIEWFKNEHLPELRELLEDLVDNNRFFK